MSDEQRDRDLIQRGREIAPATDHERPRQIFDAGFAVPATDYTEAARDIADDPLYGTGDKEKLIDRIASLVSDAVRQHRADRGAAPVERFNLKYEENSEGDLTDAVLDTDANGEYVRYSDYEVLAEAVRELKAENERLTELDGYMRQGHASELETVKATFRASLAEQEQEIERLRGSAQNVFDEVGKVRQSIESAVATAIAQERVRIKEAVEALPRLPSLALARGLAPADVLAAIDAEGEGGEDAGQRGETKSTAEDGLSLG